MKKLSLKNLKLTSQDQLQREQLKTVFGGYGGYGGGSATPEMCLDMIICISDSTCSWNPFCPHCIGADEFNDGSCGT